ncbi:MAG: DUF357 domain-containing protein [Candidatus Aenigmatarchaeota archaeon]
MVEKDSLKEISKKEIRKMKQIFKKIQLSKKKGKELFNLAKSYFEDSKYFFEKEDFIRAFEAVVISWAYIDAGLHLKIFKIPESEKKFFTVE